jgi:hypothetical protein
MYSTSLIQAYCSSITRICHMYIVTIPKPKPRARRPTQPLDLKNFQKINKRLEEQSIRKKTLYLTTVELVVGSFHETSGSPWYMCDAKRSRKNTNPVNNKRTDNPDVRNVFELERKCSFCNLIFRLIKRKCPTIIWLDE